MTTSISAARSSWRAKSTRRWAHGLTTLAGRDATADELRESANQFSPGIGATFTLHCRTLSGSGSRPVLVEVRQCVDNDGPGGAPGTLLDCGAVGRRDQGCGASFQIVGSGG